VDRLAGYEAGGTASDSRS